MIVSCFLPESKLLKTCGQVKVETNQGPGLSIFFNACTTIATTTKNPRKLSNNKVDKRGWNGLHLQLTSLTMHINGLQFLRLWEGFGTPRLLFDPS